MNLNRRVDRVRRSFLLGTASALALVCLPRQVWAADSPLRIGIIGAGRIGSVLGTLWVEAGHEVFLSSRHPENLVELAERLGPRAHAGTPAEAAAFGEVVLVSVPYGALPQIGRDHAEALAGKVVLETGNPQAARDGAMADEARAVGTGIASARFLPGVRLVRAFTSVPHFSLRSEAHRPAPRVAVPLAGDDRQAVEIAARLTTDAGFEPVVVGDLSRARDFDIGSPVFARAMTAEELRRALDL